MGEEVEEGVEKGREDVAHARAGKSSLLLVTLQMIRGILVQAKVLFCVHIFF